MKLKCFVNRRDEIEILSQNRHFIFPRIVIVVQFNDSSKAETSSIINKTETKETGKARREKERERTRRKKT